MKTLFVSMTVAVAGLCGCERETSTRVERSQVQPQQVVVYQQLPPQVVFVERQQCLPPYGLVQPPRFYQQPCYRPYQSYRPYEARYCPPPCAPRCARPVGFGGFGFSLNLPTLFGLILANFGYLANVEQTSRSIHGIVLSMSWIPCAMALMGAAAMVFYPLDDSFMVKIEKDLALRR